MPRTRQLSPPEGFERVRLGGALIWTRPEMWEWVEGAVVRHGTLYCAARASAGTARLEGRAPVYVVNADPADRVVRHYVRGGIAASLLGDRYLRLGTWRPLLEATASERLRSNGLPTPKVLAAAVYPSGPVYRGDLVTEYVPTDGDLARVLFEGAPLVTHHERTMALKAVGRTIRRMSALGARHPDANVKNFLIDTRVAPPRVHLLDLDRCRFGGVPAERAARRMGDRLTSSLRKWERLSGRRLTPEEWAALHEGLEERIPRAKA